MGLLKYISFILLLLVVYLYVFNILKLGFGLIDAIYLYIGLGVLLYAITGDS